MSLLTDAVLESVLRVLATGVPLDLKSNDSNDRAAINYLKNILARLCEDVFLYQVDRPNYNPISFWILSNFSKIATGKGVSTHLRVPEGIFSKIEKSEV